MPVSVVGSETGGCALRKERSRSSLARPGAAPMRRKKGGVVPSEVRMRTDPDKPEGVGALSAVSLRMFVFVSRRAETRVTIVLARSGGIRKLHPCPESQESTSWEFHGVKTRIPISWRRRLSAAVRSLLLHAQNQSSQSPPARLVIQSLDGCHGVATRAPSPRLRPGWPSRNARSPFPDAWQSFSRTRLGRQGFHRSSALRQRWTNCLLAGSAACTRPNRFTAAAAGCFSPGISRYTSASRSPR